MGGYFGGKSVASLRQWGNFMLKHFQVPPPKVFHNQFMRILGVLMLCRKHSGGINKGCVK